DLLRGDPLVEQAPARELDGVALQPALHLLLRAVGGRVALRVSVMPVGLALEQAGAAARPGARDSLGGGGVHGPEIVAVDGGARHVVAASPSCDVGSGGDGGHGGEFAVEVVFADE